MSSPALHIARMVAEQRSALAELEPLPTQEIVGLTSPLGASALGLPGASALILRVIVERWRRPGGPVRDEPLFLRAVGDEAFVDRMIDALPGDRVARFALRFEEPAAAAPAVALLVELLDPDADDPELRGLAAARIARAEASRREAAASAPADLRVPRIAPLRWDASLGEWEGTLRWGGRDVRLRVEHEREPREAAEARLRRFLARRATWQRSVRALLDGAVLALKNTTWLDDDETPLSAARFARRVRLATIVVGDADRVEFWYTDDDLFGGHDLRIVGRGGPETLEFSLVG